MILTTHLEPLMLSAFYCFSFHRYLLSKRHLTYMMRLTSESSNPCKLQLLAIECNFPSTFIRLHSSVSQPISTQPSNAVRNVILICAHIWCYSISSYRKQGNKLRRLMTYAWPCLLAKHCVDPATKYHGHLLLSHIIAKFAIHKRIVLQVRNLFTILWSAGSPLVRRPS